MKKLQGAAAGSAMWVTNVGNERGEVLMSVVTQSEGAPGLQKMTEGLMMRYDSAKEPPPYLLYTDRDCCSKHSETLFSVSLYNQMIQTHCFESLLAGSFLQVAYNASTARYMALHEKISKRVFN